MVRNSEKTYGQLLQEARSATEAPDVGEVTPQIMAKFQEIIEDAVNKNYEKGVRGKYYIHIWVQKDPYAQNAIHIYPQCRRTRPSPYQGNDHYLWSVMDGGQVNFEWCIPKKEVLTYILAHPNEFDKDYVCMLRKYCQDKLERLDDYVVDGKVI